MSNWEKWEMESRIREVLRKAVNDRNPDHPFGRPLSTPYQIAIGIVRLDPGFPEMSGLPIGGEGTGDQETLSKYIARELTIRIRDGRITDIEGFFLSDSWLKELDFHGPGGEEVEVNVWNDISLFRLKE
ncbi:hypothetical protein [Staphylospora marina]|uniref:hypothetical protein n=1 Tax=Staphylospora marina TaxID=2490858 RepID=UPI000F5BD619|nr:hypothetical protein [Staphylospora marina]